MKQIVLLAAASPLVFAQISGTVLDESGGSVSGAVVRVESVTGGPRQTVATGADGRFTFAARSGRQVLTVEAPEFDRFVKEIAGAADVRVVLRVGALSQQVAVTASASLEDLDSTARATSVLDRGELDRRLEFSVAESLREVPGVRLTQLGGPGASTNIRIRGLRAQDTAVLIDGMRLRDPAATQADASAFTSDLLTLNISRLEVLRGCGSALYGSNAMGGVVNIVSESGGGGFRGDLLTEGGGLGFLRTQARLSGGVRDDQLTYSLGLGHLNVMEGVDGDDRARVSSVQGFTQYRPKDMLLLSARVSAANSFLGLNTSPSLRAGVPRTGIVPGSMAIAAANDPDSRRASWLTSALFAADQQLTANTGFRVAYQWVDARRGFPNGPGGPGFQPLLGEESRFNGRVDTAQARLHRTAGRHITSGGVEYEREAFDNSGLSRGFTADETNRARVAQHSWAAFAEDRWRMLGDRMQVTLSGRYQSFDLRRPRVSGELPAYLSTPLPSPPRAFTGDAALMYRVAASTKLRAHVGSAYRAPSLYERFGTGFFGGAFIPYGDPRLSPERSLGGDAGVDHYLGQRRVRLSATYFYTHLRSVIGFDFTGLINRTTDPFGRSSGYFNTAGGLARGVELEGEATAWKGFQIRGSYTHTRTLERRAVALGTLRTPRIFTHTFAFSGSQTWRRLTFTGNFFGAPEFLGVISGRAVAWPGPKRLDATASYQLRGGERLRPELFTRVENLLGQTYFEDGFRTPGRWMVGGFRLSF